MLVLDDRRLNRAQRVEISRGLVSLSLNRAQRLLQFDCMNFTFASIRARRLDHKYINASVCALLDALWLTNACLTTSLSQLKTNTSSKNYPFTGFEIYGTLAISSAGLLYTNIKPALDEILYKNFQKSFKVYLLT